MFSSCCCCCCFFWVIMFTAKILKRVWPLLFFSVTLPSLSPYQPVSGLDSFPHLHWGNTAKLSRNVAADGGHRRLPGCASALLLVQTAARRYSASVKLAVYFIFLICFKWLLKFEGRPSGWMGNKYSYRQSKESRSVFVEQKKNWQIRMSIEDEKFAPTNNKYKN